MKLNKKIIPLCIVLVAFIGLTLNAQDQQIDFKFQKSLKEPDRVEIKVTILSGEAPFKYAIYQGDPLDKGISLKEDETSLTEFTVQTERKPDLYLYISTVGKGQKKSFKIVPLN